MGSSQKRNKKWTIFGIIIAVLAVLIAITPVLITRYMRYQFNNPKEPVTRKFMIKVKGTLKQASNGEIQVPYLAGENGFFYVLIGDKTEELLANTDKVATVFGNMYEPKDNERIAGNSVRLRIKVLNIGYPDLDSFN